MDISDDVVEIVNDVITETAEWEYHTEYDPSVGIDDAWGLITNLSELSKEVAEAVITAYLNDIWKPFDPDDESTWPVDEIEEEKYWAVINEGSGLDVQQWFNEHPKWWKDILYYADPADLLPRPPKDEESEL